MSEYKKLDDWFPDGKPDGRKFVPHGINDFWFQPFYKSRGGYWHGLNDRGSSQSFAMENYFIEHIQPKQTKKVKMYNPVYKRQDGNFITSDYFYSQKSDFGSMDLVMGWIEIEAEVNE